MRAVRVCLSLVLLTAAAPALAEGEGEHGAGAWELVWHAVNLALLVAVLVYAARKPVRAFFAERRERIRTDLQEAADLLQRAEERYTDWQRKLVDLDAELEEIRGAARARAEEERERILAEAREAAERIRRDASAAVDQELRRAQQELRREAADLAVDLAAETMRDQLTEGDRDRLVDEFISRVEHAPKASAAGAGR